MTKSGTNRKEKLPLKKKKVSTTSAEKKWTKMMGRLEYVNDMNHTFKIPAGKNEKQDVKDLNEFVAQLKRSVKGTSPVVWKLTESRSAELEAIGFNEWVKNEETVKATARREEGRKFLEDLAAHNERCGSYIVKQSDKRLGKMYKKIRHCSNKRSLSSLFTEDQLNQLTEWGVFVTKDRRQGNRGHCTTKVRRFNLFII